MINNFQTNIKPIEYISNIKILNISYRINTVNIEELNDINYSTLYRIEIIKKNIINKFNIAIELSKNNSNYLINFLGKKYLINKLNNNITLINLFNKNTQILKNNENFKLGIYDYMLYNNVLLIPMIMKKIFDNNYGTSYNMYVPRV